MSDIVDPEGKIEMESGTTEAVPNEIPLETNVVEEPKKMKTEDDEYQDENIVNSVKRESPSDDAEIKTEQETPSKTVSASSTHSTGNGDFEVSDDDYTTEFLEFSSKRRRRDTRLASQQAATCPILKGQYSIEEKMCIWEGKWGMGVNGQINGITSDFRYTMILSEGTSPSGPQSGLYNGFFWMKTSPPKRIVENNLSIQFTQEGSIYHVSGNGENKLGVFSLEGTYNPETMDMVCSKLYRTAQTGRVTRRGSNHEETGEREYHNRPREATPSFLRESIDVPPGLNEDMKMCYKSLKRLMNHKWAGPFLQPVDPVALNIPDYFDIIKQPMDLGTIQKNIENHLITTKEEFAAAVQLVFSNAVLYNKPQDDVTVMANTLKKLFEKDYNQITRRLFEAEPEPSSPVYCNKIPKHSYLPRSKTRSSKSKSSKSSKNKKAASTHRNTSNPESLENMMNTVLMLQNKIKVMEEKLKGIDGDGVNAIDNATPMTVEEKKMLSLEINNLGNEELQQIITIIQDSTQMEQQGSEIVIDLDTLPNDTLRKLQYFVNDCKEKDGISSHPRSHDINSSSKMETTDPFYSNYNSDSDNSVNQDFF